MDLSASSDGTGKKEDGWRSRRILSYVLMGHYRINIDQIQKNIGELSGSNPQLKPQNFKVVLTSRRCKKNPGLHGEIRADKYKIQKENLFHCFSSVDRRMTAGIRRKSESMAGEEIRVGGADHIGDFKAGSIKTRNRLVMSI